MLEGYVLYFPLVLPASNERAMVVEQVHLRIKYPGSKQWFPVGCKIFLQSGRSCPVESYVKNELFHCCCVLYRWLVRCDGHRKSDMAIPLVFQSV